LSLHSFPTRRSSDLINFLRDESAAAAAISSAQEKGTEALAVRADVSRADEAQRLIDATLQRFGRVDFLVCNAGIWEGASIDEMRSEEHTSELQSPCN